jgi:hypothetical protein
MNIRCRKLHAIIIEPGVGGVIEMKCNSRLCGAYPGRVVLHRWSTETGKLLDTQRFKNPERGKSGTRNERPAVRSA